MKRFIYSAFIAFLASAATIGVLAILVPEPQSAALERTISPEELSRHASASDCWLAVSGAVYDVSGYVPAHPAPRRVLVDWCGKEATAAFDTKGRGRPHSSGARAMLARYRLGKLL